MLAKKAIGCNRSKHRYYNLLHLDVGSALWKSPAAAPKVQDNTEQQRSTALMPLTVLQEKAVVFVHLVLPVVRSKIHDAAAGALSVQFVGGFVSKRQESSKVPMKFLTESNTRFHHATSQNHHPHLQCYDPCKCKAKSVLSHLKNTLNLQKTLPHRRTVISLCNSVLKRLCASCRVWCACSSLSKPLSFVQSDVGRLDHHPNDLELEPAPKKKHKIIERSRW